MKLRIAFLILVNFVSFISPSEAKQSIHRCHICFAVLSNKKSLKAHVDTHNPATKIFKCTWCPKKFRRRDGRDGHLRTHTGERPFKCGDCGKAFADKSNLARHRRSIHKRIKYVCEVCQKGYYSKGVLNKHIEKHQDTTQPSPKPTIIPLLPEE